MCIYFHRMARYDYGFEYDYNDFYMKKNAKKSRKIIEDRPNRAFRHHGSTTRGGSNFGQGSLQLGRHANRQGSESNKGSNYNNEQGWNNEALRTDNDS